MNDILQLKGEFKQFPYIKLVIVFGSFAQNAEKQNSDIDIAVAGETLLTVKQKIEIQQVLTRELSREIDLLDLHEISGVILQQILVKGVIIQHSSEIYARVMKKMLFNQADMMPLTNRVLQKHCQRFIYG